MMEMAKVTSKGQITIPISIRRRLEIKEGDKILFINKYDGVLMVNPDTVQGDLNDITAEAVPLDAVAGAQKAAASSKTPAKAAPAKPAVVSASPIEPISIADPIEESPPRRKFYPPVEDVPEKPTIEAGGINLNTLLDDLRSIGNI